MRELFFFMIELLSCHLHHFVAIEQFTGSVLAMRYRKHVRKRTFFPGTRNQFIHAQNHGSVKIKMF